MYATFGELIVHLYIEFDSYLKCIALVNVSLYKIFAFLRVKIYFRQSNQKTSKHFETTLGWNWRGSIWQRQGQGKRYKLNKKTELI